MEYDGIRHAVEQHYRLKRVLPKGLQDVVDEEPDLLPIENYYLSAYWNLSSERNGSNSIPWSKIVEYGERSGLDSTMISVLVTLIRKLEFDHNKWVNGERTRKEMVDRPSPAQRAKNMSNKRG